MQRSLYILLAGYEEIIYQTVTDYLRDSGHEVDRVQDVASVLKAVEVRDYDLALIDLEMSSADGFSLLTNMQELRPNMPVVVINEYRCMETAIKALQLGAMDFLLKPIKLLKLDAILEKSIRFRNMADQLARNGKSQKMNCDYFSTQKP